ncbi:hypothetical protein A2875_04840 [Candidatus Gottesmanbacteria bacterium RIFCSPHIGHO2_01_FULL_46_14]|uniref:Nucleotidyltransferase n=3 Tax=Candidatus Gottesmaniibacteriota TaxID=1752720 RepID=A0A1F5ZP21_9BACT|nr:MAG: Nucleotidyltransferase substrate binding protein, HI0074 family [Candidatus Gottesmanbacteria bacterium GW2011_GWA1_47_8]OGG14188.1 MAG: hypothetical protein A2875_04840 [Candidatus Gottesmanbacteria bacterium RIFCSPHIGHO2_01_FULL_46_14]OGG29433.1 MAG: hypothetical protein A2971_02590 [Candidatus Gottesmanbacteria bacterium RIFCSPLOWO2_01_FULL_46_21]
MENPLKEKTTKQYQDLQKAIARLKETLALPPTRVHKDATIKRFELCFELAWKLLQSVCRLEGSESVGIRTIIRSAAQLEVIDDPSAWMSLLDARNETVHMYNESVADKVYEQTKNLVPLVEALLRKTEEILTNESIDQTR